MFEGITESLTGALSFFGRTTRLSEANIREGMRQVRQALLEADVAYEVAQDFVKTVTAQAVGEDVLKSLKPSEMIVGIVHQELINLMGPVDHSLRIKRDGVSVIMMCGLQGSGKTTTCGKLAHRLKADGINVMLVAADLQRPAAVEQLKTIGAQVGVPVYSEPADKSTPVKVCQNAVKQAKKAGDIRVVILDTAGRLGIDEELMNELRMIDNRVQPDQALLVTDAMTGQDAVNSAKAFNDALELDGVVLTKLDGDTRGGAALSVKAVTGVPIKFAGISEKLDGLDVFDPERMAGRILGMGDIVGLVEKAQKEFDEEEILKTQKAMEDGKFTLEHFRSSMKQIKRLGSMGGVMKMIPGMGRIADMMGDSDPDNDLKQIEGIINSMTMDERSNPDRIDRSRRNRIAMGSGTEASDVNQLLKQFKEMSGMMQQMAGLGMRDRMKAVKDMADGGMLDPGARIKKEKQRSVRGPADTRVAKVQKKNKRKDAKKQKRKNRR